MFNKDQSTTTDNMEIGDNAKDVLQVNGPYIDMRSDYLVIKEVFTDLYNANNYKVQQELMSRVEDKINLLSYKFSEAIEELKAKDQNFNSDDLMRNMNDPSIQMLANQCLYQSVYKNEDYTVEILAKLLAEKVAQEKNDFIIEDCVESLKFISINDINFISFIFLINYIAYSFNGYSVQNYFKQIQDLNISEEQKGNLIEALTKKYIQLYNNICSYFLGLNPSKTDYNYLMNKGWFYSNIIQMPTPIENLSQFLKKKDGSNYSIIEIKELIPHLDEIWMKYNGKEFQGNKLSATAMLLADINTKSIRQHVMK